MAISLKKAAADLRQFALGFPGAVEEFPWGESVAKVNKRVFVFLSQAHGKLDELAFSVKLPQSGDAARREKFVTPTAYGLGKSGWVTIRTKSVSAALLARCRKWIEESYRTIAPQKLIRKLDGDDVS
ncbi:MAG: MmcQ/YjbR family DNA-binding protein [Deltaproteobacteria bacterium]|nr:MmcQ/YjbR family DNA-binding protein [Deltaproteobacteria bacterium]